MGTIDAEGVSEQERMESWWTTLLLNKMVTHTGGDKSESLNTKLRRRLQTARDGEWLNLTNELMKEEHIEREDNRRQHTRILTICWRKEHEHTQDKDHVWEG